MRATISVTILALFAIAPPTTGQAAPARAVDKTKEPGIAPTVLMSPKRGFSVKPCVSGKCRAGWSVIPRTGNGRYDHAGLRKVLQTLRLKYRRLPALHLYPGSRVPWLDVLRAMDAARRTDPNKPLFPVILIGLSGQVQEK